MSEVALGLSIVAICVGLYALFTLNKLMQAMSDLSSSLSNTVDKLSAIEQKMVASERKAAANLAQQPRPLNIVELIPALLQKNGNAQWIPLAMWGFRTFEAYYKKRRLGRRNGLRKADVSDDNREERIEKGQVL